MAKKILIVDDSALMRRMLCDIISADDRFQIADTAANGQEALMLVNQNTYDLIVLDLLMPKMDGISFLKEMNRIGNRTKVVVSSTLAKEGAAVTIEALSLGAVDFIKKPDGILDVRGEKYKSLLMRILEEVAFDVSKSSKKSPAKSMPYIKEHASGAKNGKRQKAMGADTGKKIVAIASSTGGPKALQEVISRLPKGLDAPVLVVQHMPAGFTATLSERLDTLSPLTVREAEDGMPVEKGNVYVARGGIHMTVKPSQNGSRIAFLDKPPREGVKPCANYMYESLSGCGYDSIICVVLTGMGADGTKGITQLKKTRKVYVIAQDEDSCAVYGMPRNVVSAGLADEIVPLTEVAEVIIKNVGVMKDGC